MTDGFRPGRELSSAFHAEVVSAILRDRPHAAALLGTGSDVLGYDTARSTDHGWGPRMHVFVAAADVDAVQAILDAGLPERFRGWPVRHGWDAVPVQHHVRVGTLDGWLRGHLGTDPRTSMAPIDWLTVPQQALLEVTCGLVHHDPDGELRRVQDLLARFRRRSGCGCWAASGTGSRRRRRSWGARPRSATSWVRGSSPPGWSAR